MLDGKGRASLLWACLEAWFWTIGNGGMVIGLGGEGYFNVCTCLAQITDKPEFVI
jgi:hypothetical protein